MTDFLQLIRWLTKKSMHSKKLTPNK